MNDALSGFGEPDLSTQTQAGITVLFTLLTKTGGPLTKVISLTPSGKIASDGSACVMSTGMAHRKCMNLAALGRLIGNLEHSQAIALGRLDPDLHGAVRIVTKNKIGPDTPPDTVARTQAFIAYASGEVALILLDVDLKAMPETVRNRVDELGGPYQAIVSVLPQLATTGRIIRSSTSSCLSNSDTGAAVAGSDGAHVFVLAVDGADAQRFLTTLHDRLVLAGLAWMMVGRGGQVLRRSLVDRSVFDGARLVFEATPVITKPLVQDQAARAPMVIPGPPMDTRETCPDLTLVQKAKVRELEIAERRRVAPEADKAQRAFIDTQSAKIVERSDGKIKPEAARKVVERQIAGILLPSIVLEFDDEALAGCTVSDVLADPDRFVGTTLCDPLEGAEYGRTKAKVMRRADGSLWINSFAHGRTTYEIKRDAAAVQAILLETPPDEVADRYVGMILHADVEPDEDQHLRQTVCERGGVKLRTLTAKLKIARQQHEKQKREAKRQQRQQRDSRLRIAAPSILDERLPVLGAIDEVLRNTGEAIPPMRDAMGWSVEIRARELVMAHELTAEGANQEQTGKTRLSAPEMPLLTRHSKVTLAQSIERYIEFTSQSPEGDDRPVALPPLFVEHFMEYRNSTLPRVHAIVTVPLVLPNRKLLGSTGLDRDRHLVFVIDPALMQVLPNPDDCNDAAVDEAMRFLVCDWLCDVAASFASKCVLISLALSIIERVLLPERPAFFITSGKRGGGKTTVLSMLILAVTGKRPPASAWSSNDDERRKAMLAHLADGLPALVWDNIPLGVAVSCPTLEKVLTSDTYTDRVLSQSRNLTVPTSTIMAFTGNNIGPKGDLASRSLMARLDVNRPDPENRDFTHPDAIGWTLDNRGKILRALYTILLGNPQLLSHKRSNNPPTRFKVWWTLVAAAVENAARKSWSRAKPT